MGIDGKKNKRRSSKRGKKLWRNVDVSEYVDNVKLAETTNTDLFIIDKVAKGKTTELLSKDQRKERIKNKILYQDSIIAPHDPKAKVDAEKNNSTIIRKFHKNIKKQEIEPEKFVDKTIAKRKQKEEIYDIWGVPKEEIVQTPKIYENRLKPKVFTSRISTEVSGGMSYRPTTEDHQQLLGAALDQLVKKQTKEENIQKRLNYPSHLRNEPREMQVKLEFSDDEDEEIKEEVDEDEQTKREKEIMKHYSMKLTTTQRNKKRRLRVAMAERKRAVALKRRMADIDRIPAFEKMIAKKEEERKKKLELREQKKSEKQNLPDRLGKYAFEDKPIDFLYTDELPTSLRTLKTTGSIALDIYKDFQKRNIIEPRVRVSKRERRYRLKEIQKRDAKDWDYHFAKDFA